MSKEVWLVVLGAVLALSTSVVMEGVRQWISARRVRALLSGLLRDEIETIAGFLNNLADETMKFGYIPIQRLNDLAAARLGFDRNRDWIILYRDENLRRRLFQFYQELGREGSRAAALENLKSNPQVTSNPQWLSNYDKERDDIVAKCRILSTNGQTLVTELKAVKK